MINSGSSLFIFCNFCSFTLQCVASVCVYLCICTTECRRPFYIQSLQCDVRYAYAMHGIPLSIFLISIIRVGWWWDGGVAVNSKSKVVSPLNFDKNVGSYNKLLVLDNCSLRKRKGINLESLLPKIIINFRDFINYP